MTRFTLASFNLKNLIEAGEEYYRFEQYTPEEYRWKRDWTAGQLVRLNADIVGFQEVFTESALRDTIIEADMAGMNANASVLPPRHKDYSRKAIFQKLEYLPYTEATLAFAPNLFDGGPGARRPGVAILSRLGFAEPPVAIQELDAPLEIAFRDIDGTPSGSYRLTRLSRPVLKARIPVGAQVVTVFNCHLKSKLGEHLDAPGGGVSPAEDLLNYDPLERATGSLRAGLRRMAEALVLRRAVLAELREGRPVMVLGDYNDNQHGVASEMTSGEAPFRNYAWMRRHDAETRRDRYTEAEDALIREEVERVRLHSAEKLFVRKSLRDMIYTSAFGGVYESIDQILMSRHFLPDHPGHIGEMEYFSVLNDHLTDGSHPEAPYNKLASDHGQIIVHMRLGESDEG